MPPLVLQETLNNRYGLASPKDNRRVLFTDDSEMLSRYKGDLFTRGSSDFKNALLSELLDKQIERYEDFKNLLARHGEVKIRNAGKPNEYLWVNIVEGKGINLRDAAFSREFIELPPLQKLQRLNKETRYEKPPLPPGTIRHTTTRPYRNGTHNAPKKSNTSISASAANTKPTSKPRMKTKPGSWPNGKNATMPGIFRKPSKSMLHWR